MGCGSPIRCRLDVVLTGVEERIALDGEGRKRAPGRFRVHPVKHPALEYPALMLIFKHRIALHPVNNTRRGPTGLTACCPCPPRP